MLIPYKYTVMTPDFDSVVLCKVYNYTSWMIPTRSSYHPVVTIAVIVWYFTLTHGFFGKHVHVMYGVYHLICMLEKLSTLFPQSIPLGYYYIDA